MKVFLNISNHPTHMWGEAQVSAALELGGDVLMDVPFPNVNPEASAEALQEEAKALIIKDLKRQLKEGKHHLAAAMVAGEPLMCALLIEELTKLGVRCYSATTARVSETVDGEKRSRFEFVRFRAWPKRVRLG